MGHPVTVELVHFYSAWKSQLGRDRLILKDRVGMRGTFVEICCILAVLHRRHSDSVLISQGKLGGKGQSLNKKINGSAAWWAQPEYLIGCFSWSLEG